MVAAVTSAITTVIGWVGTVITSITTGDLADLLPLFAVGIAISALLLGEMKVYAEVKACENGGRLPELIPC